MNEFNYQDLNEEENLKYDSIRLTESFNRIIHILCQSILMIGMIFLYAYDLDDFSYLWLLVVFLYMTLLVPIFLIICNIIESRSQKICLAGSCLMIILMTSLINTHNIIKVRIKNLMPLLLGLLSRSYLLYDPNVSIILSKFIVGKILTKFESGIIISAFSTGFLLFYGNYQFGLEILIGLIPITFALLTSEKSGIVKSSKLNAIMNVLALCFSYMPMAFGEITFLFILPSILCSLGLYGMKKYYNAEMMMYLVVFSGYFTLYRFINYDQKVSIISIGDIKLNSWTYCGSISLQLSDLNDCVCSGWTCLCGDSVKLLKCQNKTVEYDVNWLNLLWEIIPLLKIVMNYI